MSNLTLFENDEWSLKSRQNTSDCFLMQSGNQVQHLQPKFPSNICTLGSNTALSKSLSSVLIYLLVL